MIVLLCCLKTYETQWFWEIGGAGMWAGLDDDGGGGLGLEFDFNSRWR